MPDRLVTMVYLCGCSYRVPISADTSKAALCVMQMQAADTDCPACRDPKSDEDYCDVHKRGNYDRPQSHV